jgi:hypothetical protein
VSGNKEGWRGKGKGMKDGDSGGRWKWLDLVPRRKGKGFSV